MKRTYSKVALATALGIARCTVKRYLALAGAPKPTADGRYSLPEVRKWILRAAPRAAEPKATRALRIRHLTLTAEAGERELQAELARHVDPLREIASFLEVWAMFEAVLRPGILEQLPGKWEAKSVAEVQAINEGELNALLAEINRRIDGIQPSTPEERLPSIKSRPLPKTEDPLRKARARVLASKVGLLDLRKQVETGKIVLAENLYSTLRAAAERFNQSIYQEIVHILPALHRGRAPSEISALYATTLDRIFAEVRAACDARGRTSCPR